MNQRRLRLAAPVLWALAAGILTFLTVESAVARRVGLDLLLPVGSGVFLPGRLARLAALLVLCFALALTDRGRAVGRALDRFCERDRGRWAVSAGLTALFFLWSLRVIVLSYMTNDDPFALQAIARIPQEGLQAATGTFSHPLYCWALGKLYGLAPNGYWYQAYQLAVLLGGVTVVGRCLLCRTCRLGWPVWAGALLHGLICAGLFLYCFAAVSFTVTPAVAGTAAVALTLCRDTCRTRAGRAGTDLAALVLLCLCILQREETGSALLCFWALAAAYQLLRMLLRRAGAGCVAGFAASALAALVLVRGVSDITLVQADRQTRLAEHYRSRVLDYLNDDITPEQYERLGIPRELAVLVHGWYFMDQRVTGELFHHLEDLYVADQAAAAAAQAESGPEDAPADTAPAAEEPSGGALSDALAQVRTMLGHLPSLTGYVRGDRQMLCRIGAALALLVCCTAALVRFGRRYWPGILCALCCVGGAAVMLLYLAGQGRFPIRVFLVVMLPACVFLALTALDAPEDAPVPGRTRRVSSGVLAVLGGAALALCCLGSLYTTPHAADTAARADVFGDQWAVEQYAVSHGDKTIITSMYQDLFDPLHTPADYPANRVLWGACGDLSKPEQERLYADAFFRDDVLFMTDNMATTLYLLQYLSLDWGPVQAAVLDRPGSSVYICQISQALPAPGYTGWHEQNGMTYYFRDGQALTGEQTVDGKSYTFAPAGALSQMTADSADGVLVYATDAYSLVTTEDAP